MKLMLQHLVVFRNVSSNIIIQRSVSIRGASPRFCPHFSSTARVSSTPPEGDSSASTVRPVSHNASPRLPLLYYKASSRAMESINHRVFYANWIFVFAAYDIFTSYVDF